MSNSQGKPWSDNPNAPKISPNLYLDEKVDFAGILVASIFYGMPKPPLPRRPSTRVQSVRFIPGMIIVVFFRRMTALFNPVYRKGEPIKPWWLVCYTVVWFSLATVLMGVNIDLLSIAYIDNREFPGFDGNLPPGPYGYQLFTTLGVLNVTTNVMFVLSLLRSSLPPRRFSILISGP